MVRVPAHLRALLCAQGEEEGAIVFLHLSSFAIRWTVPVGAGRYWTICRNRKL